MKLARLVAISAVFFFLVATWAQSGELAQNLAPVIDTQQPDDMVKVWIKLHRVEPATNLKAAINGSSTSEKIRHKTGVNKLQAEHRSSQADLVNRLEQFKADSRARNIKSFWIANIVQAEVAVGELEGLASRDDVDKVYAIPEISLIDPVGDITTVPTLSPHATEDNIAYVNADGAWGMGFDGTGSIICSFDTGIDGTHPALLSRWKGHDGDSAAAWYDPHESHTFPSVISDCIPNNCNPSHGTHVMGIACGYDAGIDRHIGVAPGAQWISAAIIDIPGVNILEAFEWAADPDGNPNTTDDVPDVINHSWGYPNDPQMVIECENLFYDVIDNVEALGIVNIFASGNYGAVGTVHNPANGDSDSLDCFAVGNIDISADPATLSSTSSRGPSDCRGGIKPNVVAPGASITSCLPGGTYGTMGGTSMAAPHVAGLVALLRQKNPNATVDEIKKAILAGSNRLPSWGTSVDNDFGWGVINCVDALTALDGSNSVPNVKVYDFSHDPIYPGDTVEGSLVLQNLGSSVTSVSTSLTGSHPSLTVLDGSASFGTISEGDTAHTGNTIRVIVSDTVTESSILSIDLTVTGSGYTESLKLYFLIEPMIAKSLVTHDAGLIEFSLTNYGQLGYGPGSLFQGNGAGFTFDCDTNDLYEAGIMIGTGPTRVSSGVHSYVDKPDYDFSVAPGGNMVFLQPGPDAPEQSFSAFSDYNAASPLGLIIRQESRGYTAATGDFILLEYIIENPTASAINDVRFGLFLDWDIHPSEGSNAGGWESADSIAWTAYNNGSTISNYRGAKLIKGNLAGVQTERAANVTYIRFWNPSLHDGYTTSEKWSSLISGFGTADTYKTGQYELFQVMSVGPMDIPSGGSETIMFSLLAGDTYGDLLAAANASQATDTPWDSDGPTLPMAFDLHQNSPNPFNPSTVISFDLPNAMEYRLDIYNVLGQKVHTESAMAPAGRINVEWEAETHASGVYLYRVTAGKFSDSKKMLLLK